MKRPISRKGLPPPMDLMKLYSQADTSQWNEYLTRCLRRKDIDELARMQQSLQLGMDRLVKLKLNTEEICVWWVRLSRSVEKTMRDIMRSKNPHPLDNPLNKKEFGEHAQSKRDRDHEFRIWMREQKW